jgi:AcrR family transcriptional regulator
LTYQTFFNLPEEKRQNVIDSALEEFALYDYKTASLSRMVEKAGIAKGSMYQYFENKKDLYLFLIDHVSKIKLSYLTENTVESRENFFDLLKQVTYASSRFNLSYPRYSRILYHAARETHNEELGDLASQIREVSRNYVKGMITTAREQGQIRKDIDLDLASFCISQIIIDMEDFMSAKHGFSYSQVLEEGKNELPMTQDQMESIINDMIKFFQNGLEEPPSH